MVFNSRARGIASSSISIEETYYWLLTYMRQESSFPFINKLTDVFSASEQSAFWGAAQSRIGIQQDRISQYLKGSSEMIKQLFQLVRELRVLDEKLEPRKQWGKVRAADVALKGEYTDLVENRGGQVQPGSGRRKTIRPSTFRVICSISVASSGRLCPRVCLNQPARPL